MSQQHLKLALVLFFIVISITSTAVAQIKCDKFELITGIVGSTLELSIDTDLPDNTIVMVWVHRVYLEKGDPDNPYSVDYFNEKSTIGEWKQKHKISIASEKWKAALRVKQGEMATLGIGFEVASISDKITVSVIVPINQPDPRFGKGNSKLTGKTARVTGNIRVIEEEVQIDYPLN